MVSIDSLGLSDITGLDGVYSFENLDAPWPYNISVSHDDYIDTVVTYVLVPHDETAYLDITLDAVSFIGGVVTNLDTDPIVPMKAYTLEIMAKLKFGMNDKEAVAELREKAAKIDPNHSKATGLPGQDLFLPPDKVPTDHRYLFRPF